MTIITAHRGSSGNFPENTLPAFAESCRQKVDSIELDVHLTLDHELVVIHDENVRRTTNGRGLVRKMTLAEIKRLDAGSWFDKQFFATRVPTLKEVLNLLWQQNYQGLLNIELKTNKYHYPGIEQACADLLASQAWPFTHLYSSFNLQSLLIMHENNPEVKLALLLKTSKKNVAEALNIPFIEGMHPSINWLRKNISVARSFPKNIRIWTVDDAADLRFCFEQKVAGVITNYPERAMEIRRQVRKEQHAR